jgi:long-chain acyl-CoA synthetase
VTPPADDLAHLTRRAAEQWGDRTAWTFDQPHAERTFAEVEEQTNQVAHGLQAAGIGKGDKVVISCPNLPFFPMVYYGALKVGAVVVPLNVFSKCREIAD